MANYIEERPWGKFENLVDTPNLKVKIITVNPGQRLSYQYHNKRAEDWYIISGIATVKLSTDSDLVFGEDGIDYCAGEHIHIPIGTKHRLANFFSKDDPVVILEVQTGTYFGEDDIVRLSDDYGRE